MSIVRARPKESAWFTSANPKLRLAEIGLELDTGKFKMGDGITYWNDLNYVGESNDAQSFAYWNGYGPSSGTLALPNTNNFTIAEDWTENTQSGDDITVDNSGVFTFSSGGLYMFMFSLELTTVVDANGIVIDWRANSGIIAGDQGLDKQAQPLIPNPDGFAVNQPWWLLFEPGGTINVGIKSSGASGDEQIVYYAMDIIRAST